MEKIQKILIVVGLLAFGIGGSCGMFITTVAGALMLLIAAGMEED